MSKVSRDNKKKAKKPNKVNNEQLELESEEPKQHVGSYCLNCKAYAKFAEGVGHFCKLTKKATARKATCENYKAR